MFHVSALLPQNAFTTDDVTIRSDASCCQYDDNSRWKQNWDFWLSPDGANFLYIISLTLS